MEYAEPNYVVEALALATLCGLSAHSGYTRTARCREVKRLNVQCMAGQAEACTVLQPGWTPGQSFPFPAFSPSAAPPAK